MCPHSQSVVILALHPLLGEGLAHWIRSRSGVDALVVDAEAEDAVLAALATGPRLLIFERTPVIDAICLPAAAPGVVMLDISHVTATGTPVSGCVAGMDMIVDLVGVVCKENAYQ